ncbi:helix-turn-helix domain-containing protein [Metabacillus bambusae]|uniref:Helix-turn-helix transcriptional regulator n=1 Tax=Metabacillus bambusae TaxID=2795218 RepID=A0ABS3N9X0_9BACI|nr:helix-turn-helix transcriptional regulator [Metabacillus bambusae]MBO1515037.1 helix-turn-helix transcriptional regulator [Metabacillus bambusae]
MHNFANRLKELREKNRLTQSALASLLEFDQSTISYNELGKKEPSIESLIKLSDFFCVSLDYLVGRTDLDVQFKRFVLEELNQLIKKIDEN